MINVDIGVACSGAQKPKWWSTNFANLLQEVQENQLGIGRIYAISSALPDWNKNEAVGASAFAPPEEKRRNNMTDANRLAITKNFLDGDSDWLFTIDDDTIIPRGAITKLLRTGKSFVAGLYYNSNPPHNPIAYLRNKQGIGYSAFYDWAPGAIVRVDSVGMGCTLIHRKVFLDIMENYRVFSRPNGSLVPIHKSDIHEGIVPNLFIDKGDLFVSGNWMYMKIDWVQEDDSRMWPFFAMEYGRTEDHHFCEMAVRSGHSPWVDTTVECGHIKDFTYTKKEYLKERDERDGLL